MTDKPTALRLAYQLEEFVEGATAIAAVAELRRLHAENEKFRKRIESQNDELDQLIAMAERLEAQRDELLEALKEAVDYLDCNSWVYRRASGAIAKVKGEKQ